MHRAMFAAFAIAAIATAAAGDTAAALRQPALDVCVAQNGKADAHALETCSCIVDGLIAKIPGEDGVRMLKLIIADPKSDEESAAALGLSADETKALAAKYEQTINEIAKSCLPH